ncbi:fasciclin domain-containing protein, partial [Vibrio parahaemolyticus]
MVDTLNGAGPFTVFAPTNAAFAKLPAGTVDTLLKPENKAVLTKVL